jgi:aryl-alcohol dehydrogenase-like predicted oxidoreductase
MTLPETAYLQFTTGMRICRILNGMWQVSGAHGAIRPEAAVDDMLAYHNAGFTTWDLADHYGPAEDLIGEFRRRLTAARGPAALDDSRAFTKWVPHPGKISRQMVDQAVQTSLDRMGVTALDLLQFHWWEYRDPGYLQALEYLAQLCDEGKIRHLALTNFDTERLRLINDIGIRIVSNQVQFSLIDLRPQVQMAAFCREHNIWLLTYGTLCGGLLAEKYLGQPEPRSYALNTASLQKYKRMVDAWGGWDLFQSLLRVLKQVADKHQVTIANVAVRYILDKPAVAGVIVGARLGLAEHRAQNARVFEMQLDAEDIGRIETVQKQSRDLYRIIGDCGDEYRG